jgi:hypothetical protein
MKLIRSIAWSFHYSTGLPFDDLYSECCLWYCIGVRLYDAGKQKAKRTTYLHSYITNQVINRYVNPEMYQKNIIWELESRKSEHPKSVQYEFFSGDFPNDVQMVVDIVKDPNFNINNAAPKMARGMVHRKLINLGWTHKRAWDAIRETRKIIIQTEIGCII